MSRVVCLLAVAIAFAACATPHRSAIEEAHRIEGQVWSPYCPGRLLIDCPTKQADELRTEISRRIGAGQSSDDVMRWIRLNFGNEAIARPSGHDTVLVWSFPVALFAIGTTLLVVLLRRWTRQRVWSAT